MNEILNAKAVQLSTHLAKHPLVRMFTVVRCDQSSAPHSSEPHFHVVLHAAVGEHIAELGVDVLERTDVDALLASFENKMAHPELIPDLVPSEGGGPESLPTTLFAGFAMALEAQLVSKQGAPVEVEASIVEDAEPSRLVDAVPDEEYPQYGADC